MAVPDLWNGSILRIQTLDPRITELAEMYFPVRVGFDSEIGRLMTVHRSFDSMRRDLIEDKQAHVVTVEQLAHAFALVEARPEGIAYIDPHNPYITHIGTEQWFNKMFRPDAQGQMVTTPVRPRVRIIRRSRYSSCKI